MNYAQPRVPVRYRADMFAFIWLLVSFNNYFKDRSSVDHGKVVHS